MDKEIIEFGDDYILTTEKGLEEIILTCQKAIKENSAFTEGLIYQIQIEKVDKSFFEKEREYEDSIKEKIAVYLFVLIFFGSLIIGFITIVKYIIGLF